MIIVMREGAEENQIVCVEREVRKRGYEPVTIRGEHIATIQVIGEIKESVEDLAAHFQTLAQDAITQVVPISKPFREARREKPLSVKETFSNGERMRVKIKNVTIGDGTPVIIAGPCAVESRDQSLRIAEKVLESGTNILRLMLFKSRTSADSWQGLGKEGIPLLRDIRREFNVPIVSEATRPSEIPLLMDHIDMIQIGTRNATNYELLEKAASTGKPIFLKRGMGSKMKEWLGAASFILHQGNNSIILCERGIATFEDATRYTLDILAVPWMHFESRFPVFVDPSHSSGDRRLVSAGALAAIAAGADGLEIDVHDRPEEALVDGPQAITPDLFSDLMKRIPMVSEALRSS